jgi:hypothetical protein
VAVGTGRGRAIGEWGFWEFLVEARTCCINDGIETDFFIEREFKVFDVGWRARF